MPRFVLLSVVMLLTASCPSLDVPSPHKASSESSLEEVFLDSPSTKNKQSHCNVVFVDSPSKRSTSSSSSGGSYSTRWVLHGAESKWSHRGC